MMDSVAADWAQIYSEVPKDSVRLEGYYNHNYLITHDSAQVILRVPISNCDQMDLRFIPEAQLLSLLHDRGFPVPRVIHVSKDPDYQVHEYIDGDRVDDRFPRGTRLPSHFVPDVVELLSRLYRITDYCGHHLPGDWPKDSDTAGFFCRIHEAVERIYNKYRREYSALYEKFGVPNCPLAPLYDLSNHLTSRSLVLCHCDIHRKNCLLFNGKTYFLDWELALVADPAYDIAVHLHKMDYLPEEEEHLLQLACSSLPKTLTAGLATDVPRYLRLERVKSVLVDAIRYHKTVQSTTGNVQVHELAFKYRMKLAKTACFLGNNLPSQKDIEKIFLEYEV